MIFADIWFLAFLALSVPAIWFVPERFRRLALLAACAVFHAHYAGQAGMTPIIILATLTYFALGSTSKPARLTVVAAAVAALVVYKYSYLINHLTDLDYLPVIAAPLAISFFVFEFVHLLTDRDARKLKGAIHPVDFGVFAIFFPALASGPIKRFQQFQPELARLGRPDSALLAQSLVRILFGYYKKFCVADALARDLPDAGSLWMWSGSVCVLALLQGVRIYMDFSGYSDIAIGLAGLFNIRLPENFSFPYLARNVSEFWNRWHISLSTWIRDYIYILLGGSRVGNVRRFANLMFAMVLCGLWHGAGTNFIVWGLIHGSALLTVHLWRIYSPVRMPTALAWAFTFVFVQLSWLVFFYDHHEIVKLIQRSPIL